MKKTLKYFGVGFIAFLIGMAIVSFLAFRPSYTLETARGVCQQCVDVIKTEFIESATVSEIVNKDFDGRKVYLTARLFHDSGYVFLHDLKQEKISIPAGFDKDVIPCVNTHKSLQICTGYGTWYDHSVEVTVVGYFGKIDKKTSPFQGGQDGFNIICVERVSPTEKELKIGLAKFNKNPFSIFGL